MGHFRLFHFLVFFRQHLPLLIFDASGTSLQVTAHGRGHLLYHNMSTHIRPTTYKEPADQTSSLGYASSILNGNTVDGGLRSLTYKSIFAANLVELANTMKKAIAVEDPELLTIKDKKHITPETLLLLKAQVTALRENLPDAQRLDAILQLNAQMDQELRESGILSPTTQESLSSLSRNYTIKSADFAKVGVSFPVNVQTVNDVPGFDTSIYALAAQRRAVEEARRKEEEARRIEEERVQEELRKQEQLRKEEEERALELINKQQEDLDAVYMEDDLFPALPDYTPSPGMDMAPLSNSSGFHHGQF